MPHSDAITRALIRLEGIILLAFLFASFFSLTRLRTSGNDPLTFSHTTPCAIKALRAKPTHDTSELMRHVMRSDANADLALSIYTATLKIISSFSAMLTLLAIMHGIVIYRVTYRPHRSHP